ncbi:PHD finger protein rhinoceros-like [Drosophila hydei]|uniref:PHD finger protein rhinoceros n=1 Tax=Drosophila hydei TaxID=7224 RepID=A0A6J1LR93_DROHY|nr:PHD finger protein rhinoceros [Drosophila hydei]XP_030079343.1 PHD finger protein rhinoceros-like [Drosophila hydei]
MRRAAPNKGNNNGEPSSKKEKMDKKEKKSGAKANLASNVAKKKIKTPSPASSASSDSDSDSTSCTSGSSSSSSSSSSSESESESDRKKRRHRRSRKLKSSRSSKCKWRHNRSRKKAGAAATEPLPVPPPLPATVQALFAVSAVVPTPVPAPSSTPVPAPTPATPKLSRRPMEIWSPVPCSKRRRSRSTHRAHSTPSGFESKGKSKRSSKSQPSKPKKRKSSSKESQGKLKEKSRGSTSISTPSTKSKKALPTVIEEPTSKDKEKRRISVSRGREETDRQPTTPSWPSSKVRLPEKVLKSDSKDEQRLESSKDMVQSESKLHMYMAEHDSRVKIRHSLSRSPSRDKRLRLISNATPVPVEKSHNHVARYSSNKSRRGSSRSSSRSKKWRSGSRSGRRSRERRSPSDLSLRMRNRRSLSSASTQSISYRRRSIDLTPSPLRLQDDDLKTVRLHIKGLTRQVTKTHIVEIFGSFGPLTNVDFPIDHFYRGGYTRAGRGFAFVEYANAEDCECALRNMDGGKIDGQRIVVSPFEKSMLRFPMRRRYPSPLNLRN